ncbi:transducin family protein / WD-40 repeat family protein [Raphanus sativus]|nr:transducin family protein / WD-40 repeat family protein [Raphanus sativus]
MDDAMGDQEPPSRDLKDDTLSPNGLVKTSEFIRLIIDALNSLGFNAIATDLEKQSGVPLLSPETKQFLELVKNREWDKSIDALKELQLGDEEKEKAVRLLLLEEKVFELMFNGQNDDAEKTVRDEMLPLGAKRSCLIRIWRRLIKPGSVKDTEVVKKLKELLPVGVLVPERRLECLLENELVRQRMNCDMHSVPDTDLSLFSCHHCDEQNIPSETLQILSEHTDEVWFLAFSNDGKYLASSSKDKTAILWEMDADGKFTQRHKLVGHEKPVVAVLWSIDDQQVITCGENEVIKRWDAGSGQCIGSYGRVGVGSVSCGWLHDGSGIIGAMSDRRIYLWSLDGTEMEHEQEQRAQNLSDVAMTSDGKWIVSVGKEQHEISLFSRETRAERVIQLDEKEMIASFSLSRDDKLLLVDLTSQAIQLWCLVGEQPFNVGEFDGHKRSRFVIRSCFGGYDEYFIASGSEDSQVYIWHIVKGSRPCRVLRGHSGAVNCVSWNPTDVHMLASGSDDRTIRIWGLAKN